jgi:hypothetical protein
MPDTAALLNQTLQGEMNEKAADADRKNQSRQSSCHEGGSVAAPQLIASSPLGGRALSQELVVEA